MKTKEATHITEEQVQALTSEIGLKLSEKLQTAVRFSKLQTQKEAFSLEFTCSPTMGIFSFIIKEVGVHIQLWSQIDGGYVYGSISLDYVHPGGGRNGHRVYFPQTNSPMYLEIDPKYNLVNIISH